MPHVDAVIIGAGGAGLMCALQAAGRGRRVAVLDHAATIGKKILISGGGRCNFTNLHTSPANFQSGNPHFPKSSLARFTPADFIAMVEAHGIAYHEKKLGQLFCDRSAKDIVAMLVAECREAGAQIHLGCRVQTVARPDRFRIETSLGPFDGDALVIATGGLSVPPTGATDFGYRIARQFGLAIVEPAPALVGLRFGPEDLAAFGGLAGVALETVVTCGAATFRENILFTHTGLSGPAILQASLYWHPHEPVTINLLPDLDAAAWLTERKREGEKAELKTVLAAHLPRRLAEKWCELHLSGRGDLQKPLVQVSDRRLEAFARSLRHWQVIPSETEGYKKAEVTRGGVDTAELSSKTMECRKVPGLYFIGEVVDVTGQLGGFNFQWAWASGAAAGRAI